MDVLDEKGFVVCSNVNNSQSTFVFGFAYFLPRDKRISTLISTIFSPKESYKVLIDLRDNTSRQQKSTHEECGQCREYVLDQHQPSIIGEKSGASRESFVNPLQ